MIDNSLMYIQYNNGDKKVTYIHHKPVMMLEQGMSEEVKNDPSRYELYMKDAQREYELMGKFIPRTNVEMPPEDGNVYYQVYDENQNKVLYFKAEIQMPKEAYFETNIDKLNNELIEMNTLSEELRVQLEEANKANDVLMSTISSMSETISVQSLEMAKLDEKSSEILERNETILQELMTTVLENREVTE